MVFVQNFFWKDAKKQLLQKLIKLENEKPGRPSQHWKLVFRTGWLCSQN